MPRFEKDLVVVKMQGRPFPSVEEKDSSDWSDWPKLSRVHSILDHTIPARDPSDRCHILAKVTKTSPTLPAPQSSGRALDAAALSRWADMWCAKLAPFLDVSANFAELGSLATGCLRKVLQCKSASASTLRRHMCGLKVFLEFRDGEDAHNICNPGRLVLISFLSAVGEGKRSVACAVSALNSRQLSWVGKSFSAT